jgi:hypothetical protein
MRYRGGGVGHLGMRQCNKILLTDEHPPLGEISDSLTELVESNGSDSDDDSSADSESGDENEDGGAGDREGDNGLTQTGDWNDIDLVTAAGFGVL